VVERYARRSGLDLERVAWYHVFGVFKLVVIVQQIYIRYLSAGRPGTPASPTTTSGCVTSPGRASS